MSSPDAETLNRTAKQLFDSGRARSLAEALAILETWVLQLDVGPGIDRGTAAQAALQTAVNAGARAFLGGVRVRCEDDPVLSEGWAAGQTLTHAVERLGGHIVAALEPAHPTLAIGTPSRPSSGLVVMHTAFEGWCGGVLQTPSSGRHTDGIAPAGVLAGALGVCEAFQSCCGSPEAARRDVGVSLWEPGGDWLSGQASGPELSYLPSALWLLGLGHLGQAYAWSLGLLPYADPTAVTVYLMDTDTLVPGNLATGLLAREDDLGKLKTRVIARRMQSLGFQTRIVERLFDEHTRPTEAEPMLALAGFDSPVPRRLLGEGRFGRVIDAGLGAGAVEYLDILIHSFPSQLDPASAFESSRSPAPDLPERYQAEVERLIADGTEEAEAECGMVEVAGVSVAAAFVGAIAGALVLADVLRMLHAGPELALLSLDLRTPDRVAAASNRSVPEPINPGFTPARAASTPVAAPR